MKRFTGFIAFVGKEVARFAVFLVIIIAVGVYAVSGVSSRPADSNIATGKVLSPSHLQWLFDRFDESGKAKSTAQIGTITNGKGCIGRDGKIECNEVANEPVILKKKSFGCESPQSGSATCIQKWNAEVNDAAGKYANLRTKLDGHSWKGDCLMAADGYMEASIYGDAMSSVINNCGGWICNFHDAGGGVSQTNNCSTGNAVCDKGSWNIACIY